jgi:murein DD-endopeptidase MepM/ murein hydrolase activator NlpD
VNDQGFTTLYRFRYVFCSLLVISSLLLLSLFLSFLSSSQARASSSDSVSSQDESNIVTDGFDTALSGTAAILVTAEKTINDNLRAASSSAASVAAGSGKAAAQGAYSGAKAATHGITAGLSFAASTPVYAWHGVAGAIHIGRLITPAAADKTPVPKIDPVVASEIAAALPAEAAAGQLNTAAASTAQWPIHGYITEEFGVPHQPYQPLHTGIDISDGMPSGVTPITPFEPGRVIAVIHSSVGFGNHVIIDHGNGMTSLYGHMYSTAVQVGQVVTSGTILGFEGTTGLSTGVHVHFEIDINGQPVNPHKFVPGSP